MAVKDLIPWNNRGREVGFQLGTNIHPFFALHREMNRMFDDVFRGVRLTPFGLSGRTEGRLGWPQIDIDETDKEVRISSRSVATTSAPRYGFGRNDAAANRRLGPSLDPTSQRSWSAASGPGRTGRASVRPSSRASGYQ